MRKPFQFLMVNVLREYLEREFRAPTPFPFDKERIYDDFGGCGVREGRCVCVWGGVDVDIRRLWWAVGWG